MQVLMHDDLCNLEARLSILTTCVKSIFLKPIIGEARH